jgi:hypothetical protein
VAHCSCAFCTTLACTIMPIKLSQTDSETESVMWPMCVQSAWPCDTAAGLDRESLHCTAVSGSSSLSSGWLGGFMFVSDCDAKERKLAGHTVHLSTVNVMSMMLATYGAPSG